MEKIENPEKTPPQDTPKPAGVCFSNGAWCRCPVCLILLLLVGGMVFLLFTQGCPLDGKRYIYVEPSGQGTNLPPGASGLSSEAEKAAADLARAEENAAKGALMNFFNLLNGQNYIEAAAIFSPLDVHVELMHNMAPSADVNDKADLLRGYCAVTRSCLPIKIISSEKTTADSYMFRAQFVKDDGTVYSLKPCCGLSDDIVPPETDFYFSVQKADGRWLIKSPPTDYQL